MRSDHLARHRQRAHGEPRWRLQDPTYLPADKVQTYWEMTFRDLIRHDPDVKKLLEEQVVTWKEDDPTVDYRALLLDVIRTCKKAIERVKDLKRENAALQSELEETPAKIEQAVTLCYQQLLRSYGSSR